MSPSYVSPTLVPIISALEELVVIAAVAAREARQNRARRKPESTDPANKALHPSSASTPMWIELRNRLIALTAKRGQKAVLARQIGLPRQRIHKFLKEGSAMPDAERTLWLLAWVAAKEQGKDFDI